MEGIRYLLVLDASTATGKLFAEGRDWVMDGHPVLACTQIDLGTPGYVTFRRAGESPLPARQGSIPHHTVVAVLEDLDLPALGAPIGFAR